MDKQNFVFISYNHKDVKWAKWLQKKLEWFRLPAESHQERMESKYIRPVFRDRDNLTSGILNDELRKHLEASRYLVVICSPNAAQSVWMSDEIDAFIEMGRLDRIVPFIVDGSPNDYTHGNVLQPLMGECFPLALRKWNSEHPERSLLGISVTDDGKTDKNKAFIRLVAHLLGVSFDTLWRRHKRFIRRVSTVVGLVSVSLLALSYWFMTPVRLEVTVESEPSRLPDMDYAVINLNGSEFSFWSVDTTFSAGTLPGYYRLHTVPLTFHANRFYEEENKSIPIGAGVRQRISLRARRDSTFAVFGGRVFDGDVDIFSEHPLAGVRVSVGDETVFTDATGSFRLVFPLEAQTETKAVILSLDGYRPTSRADESPSPDLMYLLHRE